MIVMNPSTLALFFLLLPPFDAKDRELTIWEEIAGVEVLVKKRINEQGTRFGVFTSDPVRGYYLDQNGVLMLIPVRYRSQAPQPVGDNATAIEGQAQTISLNRNEVNRRMRAWREKLQREDLLREADFEKIVTQLRDSIPEFIGRLTQLSSEEKLILVIEEREPAWYFAGLSVRHDSSRKLVTLSVNKSDVANVSSKETEFPGDWINKVKRINNQRDPGSILP